MSTDNLTISLIVNTTDRAASLQTLLYSLEHQSYPYFEVIVVVGPTKDNTLEILTQFENRVRILHCSQANLGQSRNIGLLAAHGDVVAYIDDDAVPCCRWLEQLARLFANPVLDSTGGVVYLIHPLSPVTQHRLGVISSLAEQVDVRSSWVEHLVPSGQGRQWVERMMGTNMAFRRQALLAIGGFDEFFEWLFDDSDVAFRLVKAGKISYPVKEAPVYHIPASSRNRVTQTYNVRWWVQTKSVIYFCLKNGPLAGHTLAEILQRGFNFAWQHWQWSGDLWQEGKLSYRQIWRMRIEEVRALMVGLWYGLKKERRVLSVTQTEAALKNQQSITPFLNEQSTYKPAVDPISGYRPVISMPDPPLRICLLSSAYPPHEFEGVGRHTHLMAQGLFELGHTVHVITRGDKEQVSFYDGAYVHQIPRQQQRYSRYRLMPNLHYALSYSHAFYQKIKHLILNDGVQLVDTPVWQLDGLVTSISGLLPVTVRLQTALRQIATLECNQNIEARLIGESEEVLIKNGNHLIPNSKATLNKVKQVYNLDVADENISIIPHGILPVSEEAIRPFDLDNRANDTLTVLYVGRLEKRKGILDLFAAIPPVLQQLPQVRFIIVGKDNSESDGFQKQSGQSYTDFFTKQHPNISKSVSFKGMVSETELQQLYQTCDLFVAPSLYESFGLIYIEAMNYAKPVIGCQAGGIPEVVEHGVTGLLVEPQAPLALAEAIISLLKSPTQLRDMGLAGRQRILERFTYLHMAHQFEQVYRRVVVKEAP